jgi:L-rhamnose-H+ transport protein
MSGQIAWAVGVVILAGLLNGSFAAPMKRMTAWRWENSWLLFALSGLLIFPWIVTFATVPHVASVYAGASSATLLEVALFGLAWGVGSTLFGIGISRVGLALGFAIILGITAAFGSLLPLAVLHPEQLAARRGLTLMAGTLVMMVGLAFLAVAGRRREREQGAEQSAQSGFTVGLIICVLSGIFSSMLNFSLVFGDELRVRAQAGGASPAMAANPIWSLAVFGGFLTNIVYCAYLFKKNRTWAVYREGNLPAYLLLGGSMGLLWFGGVVLYGVGANWLGPLGSIVGWPVFMALDILAGLFWGAISGEWKGATRRSYGYCWAGVAILLVAIVIVSASNGA